MIMYDGIFYLQGCTKGIHDIDDRCSPHNPFGSVVNLEPEQGRR